MGDFRIAVKSFVVQDGKLLILKRTSDEVHFADAWEIPGGRLAQGEDPFEGIKRETKEEAGIDIEVLHPMSVKHFQRQDGQNITMINFLCKALSSDVKTSEEHSVFEWVPVESSKDKLDKHFHHLVDIYNKLDMHRLL